jgi:hypothetical protein
MVRENEELRAPRKGTEAGCKFIGMRIWTRWIVGGTCQIPYAYLIGPDFTRIRLGSIGRQVKRVEKGKEIVGDIFQAELCISTRTDSVNLDQDLSHPRSQFKKFMCFRFGTSGRRSDGNPLSFA